MFSFGFYVSCLNLDIVMSFHYSYVHDTIQKVIMVSSFLSFSINGIIIINNQSGISIHCYGVVDWKHVHVLFTFEQLLEGGTITNIKVVIFYVLMKFSHISKCFM